MGNFIAIKIGYIKLVL